MRFDTLRSSGQGERGGSVVRGMWPRCCVSAGPRGFGGGGSGQRSVVWGGRPLQGGAFNTRGRRWGLASRRRPVTNTGWPRLAAAGPSPGLPQMKAQLTSRGHRRRVNLELWRAALPQATSEWCQQMGPPRAPRLSRARPPWWPDHRRARRSPKTPRRTAGHP